MPVGKQTIFFKKILAPPRISNDPSLSKVYVIDAVFTNQKDIYFYLGLRVNEVTFYPNKGEMYPAILF